MFITPTTSASFLIFLECCIKKKYTVASASLAQSFKAPCPIPEVGSSNPHQCVVFKHKNVASAGLRSVYADAEETMRSVCVAAYRVTGEAT